MSSNGQNLVYGTDHAARPISALSSVTEYDVVAKGLQIAAVKVSCIADIRPTVTKFQAQSGPSCIDLIVDREPIYPVTRAMVGLTDDPNWWWCPTMTVLLVCTINREDEMLDQPAGKCWG